MTIMKTALIIGGNSGIGKATALQHSKALKYIS
jgi:NAD(P)-dependent dehydrogenase (short-subunit alcohol dehydrogenase family)